LGASVHTKADVGADLLDEGVRLQVDDVAGAFRADEEVFVVGHQGERTDPRVTDLEAADPRRFAEADADIRAFASGAAPFRRDGDDRLARRW
jgi:hypothetical protein